MAAATDRWRPRLQYRATDIVAPAPPPFASLSTIGLAFLDPLSEQLVRDQPTDDHWVAAIVGSQRPCVGVVEHAQIETVICIEVGHGALGSGE